jgi:ketosteroid isomerase-like protein
MKKIMWVTLISSLLLSCFAAPLLAQSKPADEVRQAEQKWIAAITSQDLKTLEAILSNDLIYTHSSGTVEDKSQYITAIGGGSLRYDAVSFDAPVIRIYGMTAVVATKAKMSGSNKGQPFDVQLRLLHVWVKEAGKWALVAHQTTRLP